MNRNCEYDDPEAIDVQDTSKPVLNIAIRTSCVMQTLNDKAGNDLIPAKKYGGAGSALFIADKGSFQVIFQLRSFNMNE